MLVVDFVKQSDDIFTIGSLSLVKLVFVKLNKPVLYMNGYTTRLKA